MKKPLLLLFLVLFFWNTHSLKAQCNGVIHFDVGVNANGSNTVNIVTANPNELIMIAYDGWASPGSGPVTVDGNPATHIVTVFDNNNSGIAETYAYSAPAAGTHTIVCTETGYAYPPYGLNLAAAFYAVPNTPLSAACLPFRDTTITCITGGSVTGKITVPTAGSMIYCNFENNNGQTGPFTDSWTGATFINQLHIGNGIDASEAYEPVAVGGTFIITASNNANPNNGCGGLVMGLVNIFIPPCGGLNVVTNQLNPTCGNCNGSININVSGGTPPYIYTWTPNISTTGNANGLCGGTYTCVVKDAACPPHDTTLIFTLPANALRLTDTLHANEKCFGDCNGSSMIAVKGGQTPYNYSWTPVGGSAPQANGLCAGNYTVSVTDVNGCSSTILVAITQPVVLTAATAVTNVLCNGGTGSATVAPAGGTAPYAYAWSSGQTTAIANGITAGTYTINITDANACTASTTATLTQPAPLAVNLSGPAIICMGNTGTLTANASGGTSPYAYAWAGPGIIPAGSTATVQAATQTDTVKITDANGCTTSAQITVNLGPNMTVSINGPASICKGLSTTLCANVMGGTGGNVYTWQPVNIATPCITISPSGTTTYTLTVVDNCGTTATTTTTLRIKPLPATAFTTNLDRGCAPLCIQFYNTTTLAQGAASSYVWTFGNGDSSEAQNPIYCYPLNGSYNVGLTVVSDSGCSSTLNKVGMITAYSRPATAFTYSPNPSSILEPTIQFTDKSTDQYNIIYWLWSFGDMSDSSSNLQSPSHTYRDTGSYCVNMVAMDEHGCTDTAINCLIIEPNFNLYIPSAFTPNGDKKNQTFEPKGDYIKTFEMYIFDRWGMLLYHATDITKGWDGTVGGGSIAQEDTYVYKILITDTRKHEHTYIGNISLLK